MNHHAILVESAGQFHWSYCRCGWCGLPTTELIEAHNEGLDHYHSNKPQGPVQNSRIPNPRCCCEEAGQPYCGLAECDIYYCVDCGNEFDEPCQRHASTEYETG